MFVNGKDKQIHTWHLKRFYNPNCFIFKQKEMQNGFVLNDLQLVKTNNAIRI